VALAVEVTMPKLGMTMDEGNLVEWFKREKDWVAKGEVLLVIESEKATYEVESPGSGFLVVVVEGGGGIPVGAVLGLLAESEEEYSQVKRQAPAETATAGTTESLEDAANKVLGRAAPDQLLRHEGPIRATPVARKLAKEMGIDLATITGSGPHGRVTREDVLSALKNVPSTALETPVSVGSERKRLLKEEPMSNMRATIARRMMQSLQTSAQMTAFSEWDVTELMNLRAFINRSQEDFGFRATIPGLIVALLVRVLKEMAIFNASVEENVIKFWADVNIGVAVALQDGLVVPVVHGADRKSLSEIHKALADLINRARQKKLLPDDMADGTFTLTNLGSYGGGWETIILNPPEVAILGIGRATKKPMVHEDRIMVREMMPVSVTVDHRVIDGATSGAFRQRMKELVESPDVLWEELTTSSPNDRDAKDLGPNLERA